MPLQLWVSVAELGFFFGLMALAYLVILEGAGFFNFALGPLAMFSALGGAFFITIHDWPLPLALAFGVAACVLLAVVTELFIVRPIDRRTGGAELPALVAVVATLFGIQQTAGALFGLRVLPGRAWLQGPALKLGSTFVARQSIILVVVSLLIFGAVAWWFTHAKYGRMLRAVGDNQSAARMLGLPVNRIRLIAFVIAGLIVGLAGPLFAPKAGISFHSGLLFSISGFLALVIGGTGWVFAPLVGGLILATLQVMASFFIGGAALDYTTVLLAIVFFAVRPEGIFTRRVRT